MGTSRLTQVFIEGPTRIIRGLFALAPKRRRSRVRWVVIGALALVVGVLALDRSVREYVLGEVRRFRVGQSPAH